MSDEKKFTRPLLGFCGSNKTRNRCKMDYAHLKTVCLETGVNIL